MLLAMVEELGHEYEHLMIGAAEDEQEQKDKPDPTGLVVLNAGLEAKLGVGQDDLDDDVESSEEEEEDREESEEEYQGGILSCSRYSSRRKKTEGHVRYAGEVIITGPRV